jgi:transposase
MTQDEGRFGLISDPRACWAPPGVRPKVPKQVVRQYLYTYAAVAPALGTMTSLILPYANSEMMNIFLKQVSEDFKEYFVVMLLDQAGWHGSNDLVVPENIRLVSQPSHSPKVNPTEHIWDAIRENGFYNVAFDSLEELQARLCVALNELHDDPVSLKSLTNFPYLRCDDFLNELYSFVPI